MLSTLIQKELRAVTMSSKFTITFVVCSVLLIMSVLIGIYEYKQAVIQHDTIKELAEERLNQVSSWRSVSYKEHRMPSPLQIFSSGLNYDIGRWTNINNESTVKLQNSIYSDDPIFAVFRMMDFTFIVQIVFSLLAILFTFDAVNGEKERGTLRLVFSNAVPRVKYIMAKCIGAWFGLTIPILIPILISVLLVTLFNISLSGDEWLRLIILIGTSILYMTLFIVIGVFVSTLTKRSSVSFLISLVFWIAFVLIIPRGGVMAAGHLVSVPRLAEVEGWSDAFAKNRWEQYYEEGKVRWSQRRDTEPDQEEELDEGELWANMKLEDSLRKEVTKDIEKNQAILMEDWHNKQKSQQRLGFMLSRISPAATYQLAAMSLAGTDLKIKSKYETTLQDYRNEFNNYVEDKSANAGLGAGAVMITMDTEQGLNITTGRDEAIDTSDKPTYTYPKVSMAEIMPEVLTNIGILIFMIVLTLAGAFVRFLKFDLR